jgi:hypothetical protein
MDDQTFSLRLQLYELANQWTERNPSVSAMLLIVSGALAANSEQALTSLMQTWAREEVKRLKAAYN